MDRKEYIAVIVAAGLSSRMNDFKPLMKLGDSTIIGSVIENLKKAGISKFIVVVGFRGDELAEYLKSVDTSIVVVKNGQYATTSMFDSILLGLERIENEYDAVLITPGDVPLVSPDTIAKIKKEEGDVVFPVFMGVAGHPVMIKGKAIDAILRHDGSCGLKGAIEKMRDMESDYNITEVKVTDRGTLMDADTKEDYAELVKYKRELNYE